MRHHRSVLTVCWLLLFGAGCADTESDRPDSELPMESPDAAASDAATDAQADVDASDAAVEIGDRCAIELSPTALPDGPAPACRTETPVPLEDPRWVGFWATQGEHRVFVYWVGAALAEGTTVELPHDSSQGVVTVDYFAPGSERMQRASQGTLRISAVRSTYYEVELIGVRFDALADLEINGFIGAELQAFVCVVCD